MEDIFGALDNFETSEIKVTGEDNIKRISPVIDVPGVYELYITGINDKRTRVSERTSKVQIAFNLETDKVEDDKFTPVDSAVQGGQVASAQLGIWFNPADKTSAQTDEFFKSLGIIANKAGKLKEFNAVLSENMPFGKLLARFVELVKGVKLQFVLGGDQYLKKAMVRGEEKVLVKHALKFQRYGFVRSMDEEAPTLNELSVNSIEKQVENGLEESNPEQYSLYLEYKGLSDSSSNSDSDDLLDELGL